MHTSERIQLKTPDDIFPAARAVMERHGCLIKERCVTLPAGSRRTPCLQILTITFWYDIVLPDQYQMVEAYDWRRAISILYLPPEEGEEDREE